MTNNSSTHRPNGGRPAPEDINPRFSNYPQDWIEVRPELMTAIELFSAPTPWQALFDFTIFDGSDLARLIVELQLKHNNGERRWVLSESHEVTVEQSAGPSKQLLVVDGEPVGRGKLLMVSPLNGPWPARLYYVHERSVTKTIRYMMVDHTKWPQL